MCQGQIIGPACLMFQVSLMLALLAAVTHAQLQHYASLPVEHHIEEYHHVGIRNDVTKGENLNESTITHGVSKRAVQRTRTVF
jgi:hypothetical protein